MVAKMDARGYAFAWPESIESYNLVISRAGDGA